MSTQFSEIYDLFLISVKDYRIDKLYQLSTDDFEEYLFGFMVRAIPSFTNCVQDLSDYNKTNKIFNITLTMVEQKILSDLMVIEWLKREIQDINQLRNLLNDTDFKTYSNANGLKEKSEYFNRLREIINQDMMTYGIQNINWTDWGNGNYG